MVKQQVKVVIRTRPTPDFAAKNISLDTSNEVSKFYSNPFRLLLLQSPRMIQGVSWTTRQKTGNSNSTSWCITLHKRTCSTTASKSQLHQLLMAITALYSAMVKQALVKLSQWLAVLRTTNTEAWSPVQSTKSSKRLAAVSTPKSLLKYRS